MHSRIFLIGLGMLVGASSSHARPAKPVAAQPHAPRAKPAPTDFGSGLQIMPWASLDDDAARSAKSLVGRSSTIATAEDLRNRITVYDKHRDLRNELWRHDEAARVPAYEASNSDAASSQYTSYPEWSSPQQERMMSEVKDSLGVCGWPLSCPDLPP